MAEEAAIAEAASDLELCIICMNSFIRDAENHYIRQVCNHPKEKHYCCTECLEKYETEHQEKYGKERPFLTMYPANVHPPQYYPRAAYPNTKCPCEGCPYSFYPIRDGPTRLIHTKREGKMPESCSFQSHGKTKMTNCMYSNALSSWIPANIEMYEIANFKEGRLNGKYLIIHLYQKLPPKNLPMDPWLSDSYANIRSAAMVALLTFENGLIKSVEEYVSLKHRQISEYMHELSSRLYLSKEGKDMSSGLITLDTIYQDLLSEERRQDFSHLVLMNEYQYEMNIFTLSKRYTMVYDTSSIQYYDGQKELPSSEPLPLGYYTRPLEICERTPYITPEILKKLSIKKTDPGVPSISNRPFKLDHRPSYLKTKRYDYKSNNVHFLDFLQPSAFFQGDNKVIHTKFTLFTEIDYKIVSNLETKQDIMWKTSYHDNGEIHCRKRYKTPDEGLIHQDGPEIYYYENGQVKVIAEYVKGKKEGYLFEYGRSGGAITGYAFYEKGKRTLFFQG